MPARRHLIKLRTVLSMGDGNNGTELHCGMGVHSFAPAAAPASGALSAITPMPAGAL